MMIPQAPGGAPPAALAALLGGMAGHPPGGPGPGGPPPGPPDAGADPLHELQDVIQGLHRLIATLPDPQATQVASQCLAALTRVQAQMMQTQQQHGDSGAKLLMQRLGGPA